MAVKQIRKERKPAYFDASLNVDARVRDLVGRMTIEEKIRQMIAYPIDQLLKHGRVSPKVLHEFFMGRSVGSLRDPRVDPAGSARAVNTIQKYLVEKTRLGIPAIIHSECLHGHMSPGATIFPQAIGLASTWNTPLIRQMAAATAKEARAVGVAQALAPDLDLARDPRWGRVEETYGEDPYLVSRMGVAYITGMQGEGPAIDGEHVACTAKHYAAHGSPEAGINIAPVAGGERELRAFYLPPFKAAVVEAGIHSIMPCYSEYDGIPAHASKFLLTRILRQEWGFLGYIFADYGGVHLLKETHRTARTAAQAGKQALEAGLDLEACEEYGFGDELLKLARKGEIAVALIDRAVARILRIKFLAGLFENPYADVEKAPRVVNQPAHRRLARRIAQESIILLKNEKKLLPLDPNLRKIAVIGPNANVAQFGDYTLHKPDAVTPLAGIRCAVSKRTEIVYAAGCALYGSARDGFDEAIEKAGDADAAVVVIGGTSHVMAGVGWGTDEAAATCGEGFDRADLAPPGVQTELVKAIHATGTPTIVVMIHGRPYSITPTIVVMIHGRPYSIPWMAEHIPAIIEAWYPGEEGGNALADVLFGKVNPSAKLPVSVPRSVGHVPVFYNHKPSARGFYKSPGAPDKPGRDYVFSPPTPLFAFGHGLSYTTFKASNLRLSPRRIPPGGRVDVAVDIRNTGKRTGKEVVQLYLNDVVSSVTTPVKALRGFEKIELKPGEKKTVCFVLTPDDLGLLDQNMEFVVEPGTFEVVVNGLKKTFEVIPSTVR